VLSKRIKKLSDLVSPDRLRVFDLCCDHGKIGLACADRIAEVFLIDQVPTIIEKLKATDIPCNVHSLCADASNYQFESKPRDCFIIAGIGGHLATKILANILATGLEGIEIILSPHSHHEVVWEYLERKSVKGISFDRFFDQGKNYEVIKLTVDYTKNFDSLKFLKKWEPLQTEDDFLYKQIDYFTLKSKYEPDQYKWLSFYQARLSYLKSF
tara:strand:- start:3409 stop:4044 length:636 start_codon:yes stop_codon:yes gene_type:complete